MENAVLSNSVPNGTALRSINEPVMMYVENFKKFGKAGAESIIEQCQTVVTAEQELSATYFKRFLLEIDVERSSSTFRKMRSIGEAAVRLKSVADRLPNEWTTLYTLSTLDNARLNELAAQGVLRERMTARELNAALGKTSSKADDFKITIDVSKLEVGTQAELVKLIKRSIQNFGADLRMTTALEKTVEDFINANNAAEVKGKE